MPAPTARKSSESAGGKPWHMRLYDLSGAMKKLTIQKLHCETSLANWLRYDDAHDLGQFLSLHQH